jgi:hypothetical protein
MLLTGSIWTPSAGRLISVRVEPASSVAKLLRLG